MNDPSAAPGRPLRLLTRRVALAALMLPACHSAPSTPGPSRCGPSVPATAQHPVTIPAAALAGDYDLIQVRTQPVGGVVNSGRLHLAPLDSVARAGSVGRAPRDPEHPGAVLAGYHVRLGRSDAVDAHVEILTITAVAPEGFWGWWRAEPGWEITRDTKTQRILPNPAGYFCAIRAAPRR